MPCCIFCGIFYWKQYPLCFSCVQGLERYRIIPEEESKSGEILASSSSLFYYRGVFKRLLQLYKFENYKMISLYFSDVIKKYLKDSGFSGFIQLIPPASGKLYQRGWDQMKEIGRHLNYPFIDSLKKGRGVSQKKLGKEDRWLNSLNSFTLKNIPPSGGDILILDDIKTTGATLQEAEKCLKKGGAGKIYSLTLALD